MFSKFLGLCYNGIGESVWTILETPASRGDTPATARIIGFTRRVQGVG